MINKKNKWNIVKLVFILFSILFAIPSVVYFFKNNRIANLKNSLEFQYLLNENISRLAQAIVFAILVTLLVIVYYLIIKNRKRLFSNMKDVYIYIIIISSIFIFAMPFWCSDIYYYLGIGRLASAYKQNPYYVDMKSYIDDNDVNIENDIVMQEGYKNFWSKTTVVYGSVWTIICSIVAFFSFGNLNIGLLIFKILNVLIHVGNCMLLYKLSKKKIFSLLYGLNPFILIECIANVHNDVFVVFFILLAMYQLYRKKRLWLSLVFLAMATDIKYVAILLLPIVIIYNFRNESIKVRIFQCIKYGVIFAIMVMIPYLLYIKNLEVFKGLITQQERLSKGLYCLIYVYFPKSHIGTYIRQICFFIFICIYMYTCIKLLISKNIRLHKEIKKLYYIMIFFLFLLLTNFQPWYFTWLSALMIWQKSKNIKMIIEMQILTLYANVVFITLSEGYIYVKYYFTSFVIGIFVCYCLNNINIYRKRSLLLKRNR